MQPRMMRARWVCAGLAGLVAGLVMGAGCERPATQAALQTPPAARELVILTPHSEPIRNSFAEGFWHWYTARAITPVRIHWIYRGTPQCVAYVREGPERQARGERYEVADLMFGGGVPDHMVLAAEGWSRPVELGAATVGLPLSVHGVSTRDPEGRWHATGLSTFGITYHARATVQRGLPVPATWSDLAEPRMYGWLALADPRGSGSHRESLAIILQAQGWDAGWRTITRIVANSRALSMRSADALQQVQNGVSLATLAVNFDGLRLAADSGGTVQYVDPVGATAVTPDVISVLAGARDPELAQLFVEFVLSEEGQVLWAMAPSDVRPYGEPLYHFPIRPAVYARPASQLTITGNPLEANFGLEFNAEEAAGHARIVSAVVPALCLGDNHIRLQQTWEAVIAAGLPAEALAALTAPPFDESAGPRFLEVLDAGGEPAAQLLAELQYMYAARLTHVREMLGG